MVTYIAVNKAIIVDIDAVEVLALELPKIRKRSVLYDIYCILNVNEINCMERAIYTVMSAN